MKMRWDYRVGFGVLAVLVFIVWSTRQPYYKMPGYHALKYNEKNYNIQLEKIKIDQENFGKAYQYPENEADKEALIDSASTYVFRAITEKIFPYWYGTKYDFYGTTQVPGKGKIACGYFVTTVLQQVGFDIERVRLARLGSEQMIRELVQKKHIWIFNRKPMKTFLSSMQKKGKGLYLVGLDTHAGFLLHDGKKMFFIHSTGRKAKCVVREPAKKSKSLIKSKYKVIGKLTVDEEILKDWITKEPIRKEVKKEKES